ncbi:uncharacterized protein LOC113350671 [Papaver somniferum]|uniref:uncharacterized protein LOC113350671 n=1 Tax=Papaver somniferum TaxID=3469 RepID=UPI000E6F5FF0|nr:uncharacterized protein LOC113350671 [Papaver somniferum]
MMQCTQLDISQICGYNNVGWTFQQSVGSSGGMIILWDKNFMEVNDALTGEYTLSVSCTNKSDNFNWMLTSVYGPNNTVERISFWEELDTACRLWNLPWCIGGDFNTVKKCDENKNCTKISRSMTQFNDFIEQHNLVDLPLKGSPSTALWLKLKALKEKLRVWNKEVFKHTHTRLNDILTEIQELDNMSEDGVLSEEDKHNIIYLKSEFEKTAQMEEISWKIKSKTKWLQEGDRNSAFFYE